MTTSPDPKKQLVRAILEFIEHEKSTLSDGDAVESLVVAQECIGRVFGVAAGAPTVALPGQSLLELYCLGLANYQQIAAALADARRQTPADAAGAPTTTMTTRSTESPTESPATSPSTTGAASDAPLSVEPFKDVAHEANFQKVVSVLFVSCVDRLVESSSCGRSLARSFVKTHQRTLALAQNDST